MDHFYFPGFFSSSLVISDISSPFKLMNKASLAKSEQGKYVKFLYNFILFFFFQLTQYAQEAVGSGPYFRLANPLITS